MGSKKPVGAMIPASSAKFIDNADRDATRATGANAEAPTKEARMTMVRNIFISGIKTIQSNNNKNNLQKLVSIW